MKHIDRHEYAELIEKNRQKFYRIAYSYVKNEQEALDIVSEAVYRGLVHIRDLREPDYFNTWMTRIVINTALETIRKNSRLVVSEDYMQKEPDVEKLEQELKFDLYAAMDALGAEYKTFVILKYFEGYSFKDISKLLDIPESTVKSRVYRCLEQMRDYMEGGGHSC